MTQAIEAKIDALIDALAEHARSNFALAESVSNLVSAMTTEGDPDAGVSVTPSYGGLAG
ncbi:hypothetical protein [Pandoraea sputorum]|uniref:hypothetical protein n=1 Tax=Pandoraea sputorum TaxID=93222 RepID=UPI0012589902|nr:hypothetical protein [Pandoraea sputorum]VVE82634.1 hypothetical protein PSP31120_03696 [Pandoraea sputorum]